MKSLITDLFAYLALIVLAFDLLYLYQARAWYDPYKFVEISEVIILWGFIIFGIVKAILLIKIAFK